jgi:hypothetical protein
MHKQNNLNLNQGDNFNTAMEFNRKKYSDETLLEFYRAILSKNDEEKCFELRLGKINGSPVSQEAISVCSQWLQRMIILPMHRNLGEPSREFRWINYSCASGHITVFKRT